MTSFTLRAAAVRRFLGSARLLAAVVIVLGALLAAQGARWLLVGRHERAVLKSLAFKNGAAPERTKTRPVEEFDRTIMATGMLGSEPVIALQGIIGNEALFGASPDDAQPMSVGAALPDGRKIVEIRSNEVVLEKDGQRQTETVFQQLQQQPMPGQALPPPGAARRPAAQRRKEAGAKNGVGTRFLTWMTFRKEGPMKPNRLDRISAPALCAVLSLFLWSAAQGEPAPAESSATAATSAATATTASPETPAAAKTQPGDKPAAGPTDKTPSSPDATTPNPADADKVALNLRGAGIDQVLSFLSELTGMPVMKQKDAKAQITIVNKEKVAKQDAIRMICEALRLDGTAVVMRDHIIWLVPESQVSSLDIGLSPDTGKLPPVGVITRALPVKFADVTELEKIIRPLLGKNATLIASEATRQLVITDAADRISNVQRVLAQLDALDVDNRQLQIFQLRYADSEELAPILRAIMAPVPRNNSGAGQSGAGQGAPGQPGQPGSGQPGGGERNSAAKTVNDVEVQSYKAANSLVVVAPKEKLAKIAQLVAEMDQELAQEVKLRTIPIKYASAQDLARQLGDLVRKRYDKKVREVIEVACDQRSNTIVVLSSEQNFKAIQGIVTQLDTEESLQTKTEWFELKHADAEDLAQQMNDLYQGNQQRSLFTYYFGGSPSREPQTRFVCEKRSNSLIAIAPPAEMRAHRRARRARLDQAVDAEQCAPRLYPIKHTDAKELADVLNKVFGVQDSTTVFHDIFDTPEAVGGTKWAASTARSVSTRSSPATPLS